jgi:hypothetical protein
VNRYRFTYARGALTLSFVTTAETEAQAREQFDRWHSERETIVKTEQLDEKGNPIR